MRFVTSFPFLSQLRSFSKEVRSHGLADDLKAGKAYKLNFVRRAVVDQPPEIMPALNRWLSGTK